MTSSQEPPLTRREARERERLREQQAPSTTPDAAPPAPRDAQADQPVRAVPPQQQRPAPTPAPPAAPALAAPRPAAGSGQQPSPFGGAVAAPPQQNPFAPRYPQPAAQPAPASPPAPAVPPAPAAPAQFGSRFPAPSAPPQRQPSIVESSAPERTLTRRELRAMLDAQHEHELELGDEVVATPPAAAAPAEHPLLSPPVPTRAPAPHQPAAEASLAADAVVSQKPVGHWTAQLNVPADRAEPFDQLLSRGVSHGVPTTTNALILPSLPNQAPVGDSPLASSGEIIVTDSINLPRSYGATGVHPSHIDSSDVDRLFDQVEDGAGTGGAPIAATRAISTQGAARAMMAPPKKDGVNAPLVLAVTAGVLALGVVATLVIGAVAGLF